MRKYRYHDNKGRLGANLSDTMKLADLQRPQDWCKNLGHISYTGPLMESTKIFVKKFYLKHALPYCYVSPNLWQVWYT